MKLARTWALGSVAWVLGCSSLIGLNDFKDGPATGGSAGTGATGGAAGSTPTGGAAGGGGAGGSGGSAASDGGNPDASDGSTPFSCTTASPVMDLIMPADMPNALNLDKDAISLIMSEQENGTVFVVVPYYTTANGGGMSIRTVRDNTPHADALYIGALDNNAGFRPSEGTITPNTLEMYGAQGNNVVKAVLQRNGNSLVNGPAVSTALPTPPECTGSSGASNWRAAFTLGPGGIHYSVMCDNGGSRVLYISDGVTQQPVTTTGGTNDNSLVPQLYTFQNGVHLIANEAASFRFGKTPAELQAPHQLDMASSANDVTMTAGLVPAAALPGSVVLAARVDMVKNAGELYSGVFSTADYPKLGTKSPPQLTSLVQLSVLDAPKFSRLKYNPSRILMAGNSQTGNDVIFWRLTRDAKAEVIGYKVPDVSSEPLLGALAAPLGLYDLVVWIQGDGTPANTHIRGRLLLCSAQ